MATKFVKIGEVKTLIDMLKLGYQHEATTNLKESKLSIFYKRLRDNKYFEVTTENDTVITTELGEKIGPQKTQILNKKYLL